MYARLGFSVAVAVEPDILLVDEVLAVGDEQFQRRCTEKMNELRSGGRTVVVVSHSLPQVQQICDQAVWLDHGGVAHRRAPRRRSSPTTSPASPPRIASTPRDVSAQGPARCRSTSNCSPSATNRSPPIQPLRIRFHWRAEQAVDGVAFGFGIRAADGYAVTGSSSVGRVGVDRPSQGQRSHRLRGPRACVCSLASYHIAAMAMDRASAHIYDHSPNILEFDVSPSPGHRFDTGAFTLRGTWATDEHA